MGWLSIRLNTLKKIRPAVRSTQPPLRVSCTPKTTSAPLVCMVS
jgi:hypothetical protein